MQSTLIDGEVRPATPTSAYRRAVIETALRGCAIFAGLSGKDLAPLVEIAWIKNLDKGDQLFQQFSRSYGLYIMHTGGVRLYRVNAAGDEQVLHVARPRESFAEESLFSDAGHALNAAAVQRSTVVVLARNEFLDLLRRCPELMFRVLHAISGHLRETISLVDDLRLKNTRTRLANWLIEQCPEPRGNEPQMIALSVPKRVLASELGMASETFSRALAEFQAQNLLDVQGRTLTLLCPSELENLARESGGGMVSGRRGSENGRFVAAA